MENWFAFRKRKQDFLKVVLSRAEMHTDLAKQLVRKPNSYESKKVMEEIRNKLETDIHRWDLKLDKVDDYVNLAFLKFEHLSFENRELPKKGDKQWTQGSWGQHHAFKETDDYTIEFNVDPMGEDDRKYVEICVNKTFDEVLLLKELVPELKVECVYSANKTMLATEYDWQTIENEFSQNIADKVFRRVLGDFDGGKVHQNKYAKMEMNTQIIAYKHTPQLEQVLDKLKIDFKEEAK